MKKILTLLICLLMVCSAVGCSNDSTNESQEENSISKETQEQGLIVISAPELSQAYEENEAKADEEFKGKMVEVDGKVMARGNIGGRTFVTLEAIEGSAETGVQCFFDDQGEAKKAEELFQGDTVTIKGEVENKGLNVRVVNCMIK